VKRKVKEVIKEGNEEKDSLLNEIKYKSQAAMEYLMTYGWAILIIALTLAVLYSLGILNPKNFLPRVPPGSCFVFRPNGPGTTDFVSLQGTCGYLPMYVMSSNGINSFVEIATPNGLPNQRVTVGAWVYLNINKNWNRFVNHRWGDQGIVSYLLFSNNVHFIFGLWDKTGSNNIMYLATKTISTRTWHYIVGTYDGSTVRVFIDGIEGSSVSVSGLSLDNTGNVEISYGDGTNTLNGSIANVQIYNTALTPQEIQYLYQQGLGGGPIRLGSLVGWWPLNGDAKDYSGNNNHGTIYGGVTFVQNYNPP